MDRIIIENKLRPPDCERMMVRERLLDPVIKSRARLTSIIAEPGFGKTVLMAQLHTRLTEERIWYRLEKADRDPVLMLCHLITGIRRQVPSCCSGKEAVDYVRSSNNLDCDTLVNLLVSEFQECVNRPFHFFLDDFHHIHNSDSVGVIRQLIDALPGDVRFIIGGRTRPELMLSNLRASGNLIDIGTDTLRFTAEEVDNFFSQSTTGTVDREVLAAMVRGAEGWPAALALVQNQLSRAGAAGSDSFAPAVFSDIKEYLEEEVWFNLDDELKRFLMDNALLEVMEPELCSALSGREGLTAVRAGQLLEKAVDSSVLIDRLGTGNEYRAHALFRDFLIGKLKASLDEKSIIELHRSCAEVLLERGRPEAAVDHCILAGLSGELVDIVEAVGIDVLESGRIDTLAYWLEQIPDAVIEEHPWLCYLKSQVLDRDKLLEESSRLLALARDGFETENDRQGLYLSAYARFDKMLYQNRYKEGISLAREMVELAVNPKEKVFALSRLALASMVNGHVLEALELWDEARSICDASDEECRFYIDTSRLSANYFLGDFTAVLELSASLLEQFRWTIPSPTRFVVVTLRVMTLTETGQYAAAEELLSRCGELLGQEFCSREHYLDILKARLMLYRENAREGRRIIRKTVSDSENLFLLGPEIPTAHIGNLERQNGNFDKALDYHRQALALCDRGRIYTLASCLAGIGADKFRMNGMNSGEGEVELAAAEALAVRTNDNFVLAQAGFHRAWRSLARGKQERASREIRGSLARAARYRYDHFVSREGRISMDLLAFAFSEDVEREYLVEIFGRIGSRALAALAPLMQSGHESTRKDAVRAIAAAGGLSAVPRLQRMLRDESPAVRSAARAMLDDIRESAEHPEDILTRREFELLEMLAEGATNPEIAERLVITEPTVKSHVSSIFRKLGVSTRVQAAMYFNQYFGSDAGVN